MEQNKNLKIFISYSHQDNLSDNPYIEEFKKHITPLKDNGLIEEWYDRRILPSEDYQNKIDNNLEDADIICLFISVNFLSSGSCKDEKKKAFELRKKKGIPVIPIILSPCGWKDDKNTLFLTFDFENLETLNDILKTFYPYEIDIDLYRLFDACPFRK